MIAEQFNRDIVGTALRRLSELPSGPAIQDIVEKHKIKILPSPELDDFSPVWNRIRISQPLPSILAHEVFHGLIHNEKILNFPRGTNPEICFIAWQMEEAAAHANQLAIYLEQLTTGQVRLDEEDTWITKTDLIDFACCEFLLPDDENIENIGEVIKRTKSDPDTTKALMHKMAMDFLTPPNDWYRAYHAQRANYMELINRPGHKISQITKHFVSKAIATQTPMTDIAKLRPPLPEEIDLIEHYKSLLFINATTGERFLNTNDPFFAPEQLWQTLLQPDTVKTLHAMPWHIIKETIALDQ